MIDRFLGLTETIHLMNHRQQNKCTRQTCLLAHLEATLDFSRSEFTCP